MDIGPGFGELRKTKNQKAKNKAKMKARNKTKVKAKIPLTETCKASWPPYLALLFFALIINKLLQFYKKLFFALF